MSKISETIYKKYKEGSSVRDLAKEYKVVQERINQVIRLEERKSNK